MKRLLTASSAISGQGVFAGRDFKKGDLVLKLSGKRMDDAGIEKLIQKKVIRWDDPFEIGEGKYLALDRVPVLVNHSCDPNCGVQKINTLVALRNIKKGEEITYDYSTVVGKNAEGEGDWSLACLCGAKICRKKVGNWLTLPKARLAYYKARRALPDFILRQAKGQ